jgi:hypothetical protein
MLQRLTKEVYPLRRRSSWSLIRALGWRLDSDPWSWRRGSSADVDELGAVRNRGRTMAGREPWWRLGRNTVSPAIGGGARNAMWSIRIRMRWVNDRAMSWWLGIVERFWIRVMVRCKRIETERDGRNRLESLYQKEGSQRLPEGMIARDILLIFIF